MKNPRKLTPREAARLQGFPDHFIIPVSNTQAYRQFGNSVPVKVVEKVACEMLKHLELEVVSKEAKASVENIPSFPNLLFG